MTFTAETKRCEVEKVGKQIDYYESVLEQDKEVQEANARVEELIGWLRDAFKDVPGAEKALRLLDELDDAYVQLDTEKLKALAGADRTSIQVIFDLVRGYLK